MAAGCYGLDLGSFTPFMWTFRDREKILNLFEDVCGARLTYSYIVPGGVTADLPPGWLERCETFLDEFEPVIDELHTLLTSNAIFIQRTAGIGVLPAAMAIDYGCTGPVLRGSGVDWDLRRDGEPICTEMYDGYTWQVIAATGGPLSAGPPLSARAARGRLGRFLASLFRADAGSGAVDGLDPARDGEIFRGRPDEVGEPMRVEEEAAQGRGVSGNRSAQRPDGLHDHQRWLGRAVARADPQQQFLQPFGNAGTVPRPAGGRRAGDHRVVGFGIGGD